jgi:hypothetical protein
VADDVATLEIAAVAGFLKNQIFREMSLVVAQMQPGQKNVGRRSWRSPLR